MKDEKRLKSYIRNERVWYIGGILFSLLFISIALKLWKYDFNVPFWYRDGDNIQSALWVKRLKDGFFLNEYLGAPFASLQVDFPLYGDALNLAIERLILALTKSVGMTVNVFYLMLFPLTFCTSFFVMRKCDIDRIFALSGSLLYTFLPYRFLRGTAHIYLSNFSFIPFTIYFCMMIYTRQELKIRRKDLIYFLSIVPFVALSGIYYAFFSCFFIALSIVLRYFKDRKVSMYGVFLILEIIVLIGIAMVPTVWLLMKYGSNTEAPVRSALEAEVYGLKITQFFIPNTSHGIGLLEKLIKFYSQAPVPNEGSEYLGIAGAIGLLISLFCSFTYHGNNECLKLTSKLNLAAILLATVGGFSSLFALIISPQIRAYNRISVFIGFFAIMTISIVLTNVYEKKQHHTLILLFSVLLTLFSLVEQSSFDKGQLQLCADDFYSDEAFVREIESYASDGAMIYQYPYYKFPETPPSNNMGDYALARGYLHSKTLRWSYGDYKGRNADLWNRSLSEKPVEEQIEIIGLLGFEGIYIDQYAYTEEELTELRQTIENVIGDTVCFTSDNERLCFYGLKDYKNKINNLYSDESIEKARAQELCTSLYSTGFSSQEGSEDEIWRWCDKKGELLLYNPTKYTVHITFSAKAYSGYEEESLLKIRCGDEKEKSYTISSKGVDINYDFELSEGEQKMTLETNAKKVNAPNDSRDLYFRLENPKITIDIETLQ